MSYPEKRSNEWFLLPVFLGIIGGLIAFFVLRQNDDLQRQKIVSIQALH